MDELNDDRFLIKSGNESLVFNGIKLKHKLIEFWQWSSSDILSNATRGKFAEFIVAIAMDVNLEYAREEWGEYDLTALVELNKNKLDTINIEVKSSAFLQTWNQDSYSKIIFSINKRGDWKTKLKKEDFNRPSDVYVFCLLNHKEKETVDPLNLDQWVFYVLSTKNVDKIFKDQSSVSLSKIEKLTNNIKFNDLKKTIIEEYKKSLVEHNGT